MSEKTVFLLNREWSQSGQSWVQNTKGSWDRYVSGFMKCLG